MAAVEKLDLYKMHRADYVARRKPVIVDPVEASYLGIEGRGAPGGEGFEIAIGALYGMAFTVKMTRKMAGLGDYAVSKLEARWWHGVPSTMWRPIQAPPSTNSVSTA